MYMARELFSSQRPNLFLVELPAIESAAKLDAHRRSELREVLDVLFLEISGLFRTLRDFNLLRFLPPPLS